MWFIDKNSPDHWIFHRIKKPVASVRTLYQKVDILDTYEFGRMVILDGKIQSAESDEIIYHEILVHPAMIAHPKPERVLILGAGEGATLREVLKHPTVKNVVMIDIDREFVDLCKRHLKKWHQGSFSSEKLTLIYDDAFAYLRKSRERFDVIIGDITDPDDKGPAHAIYTMTFYSLIEKTMKPDGIFVTHTAEVYYVPHKNYSSGILMKLRKIFPNVSAYCQYIPSFGALWSYAAASFKHDPDSLTERVIGRRLKQRQIRTIEYYTPEIHKRLFIMPPYLKRNIS